jgi:hypothetical protein
MTFFDKKISLLFKFEGVSYSFDVAEFEYDKQIAISPTNGKGEVIKLNNHVYDKNVIYRFVITIWHITKRNNVCMYGIPNSLNSYFFFARYIRQFVSPL